MEIKPPTAALGLVGHAPTVTMVPASQLLILDADAAIKRKDHNNCRLAVILSHAACDLQTEQTLAELMTLRKVQYLYKAVVGSMGSQVSLHVPRVLAFYTALSDDNPTQEPWWPEWKQSLQRRNEVAHSIAVISEADALATLKVCSQYVAHLRIKFMGLQTKLEPPPSPKVT